MGISWGTMLLKALKLYFIVQKTLSHVGSTEMEEHLDSEQYLQIYPRYMQRNQLSVQTLLRESEAHLYFSKTVTISKLMKYCCLVKVPQRNLCRNRSILKWVFFVRWWRSQTTSIQSGLSHMPWDKRDVVPHTDKSLTCGTRDSLSKETFKNWRWDFNM